MKRIAVEKNLRNVKDYFENQGYKVDVFNDTDLENIKQNNDYDAIVLSGMGKDLLGIQNTSILSPVIDASGMSPEEILNRIDNRG